MKQHKSPYRWRHFEPAIILLCVRWYCRYQLSYRDLEEMMRERGVYLFQNCPELVEQAGRALLDETTDEPHREVRLPYPARPYQE